MEVPAPRMEQAWGDSHELGQGPSELVMQADIHKEMGRWVFIRR